MPYKDHEKRKEYQKKRYHEKMADPMVADKERERNRFRYRAKFGAKTSHDMVSKKKAIEEGKTRYFTGLPCKNGHVAERVVSNSACLECLKKRSAKNWEKPHYREYRKNYDKWYRKTFPEKNCAKESRRRATKLNATPKWSNQETIDYVYWACRVINDKFGTDFSVDHIVPLKGKNVCGLHVEYNLQLLPLRENISKSNSWEVSDY